jgi:hypothetical protein
MAAIVVISGLVEDDLMNNGSDREYKYPKKKNHVSRR